MLPTLAPPPVARRASIATPEALRRLMLSLSSKVIASRSALKICSGVVPRRKPWITPVDPGSIHGLSEPSKWARATSLVGPSGSACRTSSTEGDVVFASAGATRSASRTSRDGTAARIGSHGVEEPFVDVASKGEACRQKLGLGAGCSTITVSASHVPVPTTASPGL